jgi:hypothetical protein
MASLSAVWLCFFCAEASLRVAFSASVSFRFGWLRRWTFAVGFHLAQVVWSANGDTVAGGAATRVGGAAAGVGGVDIFWCKA